MQAVQFEKIKLYQLHFFILSIPVLERGDIYIMPDINTVITENGMQRLFAWVGGLLGINLSGINSSIGGASNEFLGKVVGGK